MKEAFDIVLFGGSGDLALRKLVPALFRAEREGEFPPGSRLIASCLTTEESENYIERAEQSLRTYLGEDEYDPEAWDRFRPKIHPLQIDLAKNDGRWQALGELLSTETEHVRLFYLAVPPSLYGPCCENLATNQLITEKTGLVVEKPIGYDGTSAEAINAKIGSYFHEDQIFRIDHYLGKETVLNLLALRFSNSLFEHIWNATCIDHVQISISETVGLEKRASFYDGAGAMRDMVQNHLLQLLCLVAMESPNTLNARNIHTEKLKILEALRSLTGKDIETNTVRGQFVAGMSGGEMVPGYLQELGKPDSTTETFVAIRAKIDNWRWSGVPFYLRTGKRMKAKSARIVVQFKQVSHRVFPDLAGNLQPNRLMIQLQPDETIELSLMAKDLTRTELTLQPVKLNLNFAETYKNFRSDAYKRLMLDAADFNHSLFIHRDEVSQAWAWVDPIIEGWKNSDEPPQLYRAGTWGPKDADKMIIDRGRQWFNGDE